MERPNSIREFYRDNQRSFLKEALALGLNTERPNSVSEDSWINTRNLLGAYLISDASITKLSLAYERHNSDTSRKLSFALSVLYSRAPAELKEKFPLDRLKGSYIQQYEPSGQYATIRTSLKVPSAFPIGWGLHPKLEAVLLSEDKFGKYTFISPEARNSLMEAIENKSHLKKPNGVHEDLWIRRRNMFGIYISTGATLDQLGQIYGISRERVRQESEAEMASLNLPPGLKNLKRAGDPSPEYQLLVSGGRGNRIMEALDQGKKGVEVTDLFYGGRRTETLELLRSLNIEVEGIWDPEINKGIIKGLMDDKKTNAEVQAFLDSVDRSIYVRNQEAEKPFILSPITLSRDLGIHVQFKNLHLILEAIRKANIPMGHIEYETKSGKYKGLMQNYYFVAAHHQDRAIEALSTDPALQGFLENPVKQIHGARITLPSSGYLKAKKGYDNIFRLYMELGIKKRAQVLDEDCPVPIFSYNGSYYYPVEKEEDLKAYLKGFIPQGE